MVPNFFLIGAAKSGTTALYSFLRQHSQIFIPDRKEPHFFAFQNQAPNFAGPEAAINQAVIKRCDYDSLYRNVRDESAIGDCSTSYLYVPDTAERIHASCPDAKIIVILRNPVDRAYSSYLHLVREGKEPLRDFRKGLDAESQRTDDNWGLLWRYVDMGLYYEQLSRYVSLFDRDQIKILLYDDFRAAPGHVLKVIFDFLDVDSDFDPDTSATPNVSGEPKLRRMHEMIKKDGIVKSLIDSMLPAAIRPGLRDLYFSYGLRRPPLTDEVRDYLRKLFRADIIKTQGLIDRDLTAWLE